MNEWLCAHYPRGESNYPIHIISARSEHLQTLFYLRENSLKTIWDCEWALWKIFKYHQSSVSNTDGINQLYSNTETSVLNTATVHTILLSCLLFSTNFTFKKMSSPFIYGFHFSSWFSNSVCSISSSLIAGLLVIYLKPPLSSWYSNSVCSISSSLIAVLLVIFLKPPLSSWFSNSGILTVYVVYQTV